MANLFKKKNRHIIPNWRSFENTAKLGELNGSEGIELDSTFRPDISDLTEDWGESQSIGVAGDILGAALVSNQEDNTIVREISKYILLNRALAPNALVKAAENVLKPRNSAIELTIDINSPDIFDDKSNLIEIHIRINLLRRKLHDNPINPINWVEIARYYSILGQEKKAERAIKNALYLSPENRFILRSVARFFVHVGDSEFAHDVVRRAQLTKHDPWLLATEISLATLRERNSKFVKTGFKIIESDHFHPFNITELAGSLATLEMKSSSLKLSKKLFNKSLIRPNDNSLAQAEWASQEEKTLNPINPFQFQLINSFEAMARDFAEQEKWQESIDCSKKWFFDLPFSKMSVLFGNEIASSKLKDHNQAVEVAKLGLISHPNDVHLLNNIIYSLCRQDKITEAETYLKNVRREDVNAKNEIGICMTATRGLYYYRKGFHDMGRQLYLESIKMAQEAGNYYLNSRALINFVREEILLGKEDMTEIVPNLETIARQNAGKDIANEADEVIKLFHDMRNKVR